MKPADGTDGRTAVWLQRGNLRPACALRQLQGSVVVAVSPVGEVQVTGDEIVHMVAVRHGLVSALGSMAMSGLVSIAGVGGRA